LDGVLRGDPDVGLEGVVDWFFNRFFEGVFEGVFERVFDGVFDGVFESISERRDFEGVSVGDLVPFDLTDVSSENLSRDLDGVCFDGRRSADAVLDWNHKASSPVSRPAWSDCDCGFQPLCP
jgi:hypothetical protein